MSTRRKALLVTVSNRLPVTLRRGARGPERVRSSGGLVAAFEPMLEHRGGVWVGWPGLELRPGESLSEPDDLYQIKPVGITKSEVRGYYHGFSNRTLWPVFHTLPGRASFDMADWESYERVNQRFADVTANAIDPGDLVLVNDYHLMLAPAQLRHAAPTNPIGFFLHIPFPPYDVYRVLPWGRNLLRGVLGADLIGFHVSGYVRNFVDCVQQLLGARVDRRSGLVEHDGRTVRVAAFPLGIDFPHFESLARSAPEAGFSSDERVILGVDRLDYTKGIPERLTAFAHLLETHPEHRQRITFLQLAVPSRAEVTEYRKLKREIDELVGQINGRFSSATWTPIHYLYRSIPQDRLAALYRDADVALVTPLRDGMNLVAKEFVACQVDDPGVLVLSRMAGAAETMTEALLVNPYDVDDTAAKLHRALSMPLAERRSRMKQLRQREATSNVHAWARKLIARIREAAKDSNRERRWNTR
ncbi:MAG: glycosyltransferase [Gemmatimonadales bacterium]|nr:glycosyltransferase [Gemmatimonadales bacterium]NIN12563.1 glycosyltransferase [Gemmatimonadales bacterium]NIR03558.1 glycosyltransferase [Gemmatimonadales bacterium]NIS65880.1 glycosyltransferase [Gemmatimonadales bacterium]